MLLQLGETGLLPAGSVVMDAKRRFRATVLADGSLLSDCGAAGSIHKLGSTLQNAPSCNGWTFWHSDGPNGLTPVDALRQQWLLATQP